MKGNLTKRAKFALLALMTVTAFGFTLVNEKEQSNHKDYVEEFDYTQLKSSYRGITIEEVENNNGQLTLPLSENIKPRIIRKYDSKH